MSFAMATTKQNRRGYEGYKRRPGDGRERVICSSCNASVAARSMTIHKKGTFHRQNKRIRALLSKPCITQIEIAERLGVTTQRVQQIAARILQVDGHARQRVCTLRRVSDLNDNLLKTNRVLVALRTTCAREGLTFEAVTYLKNEASVIHCRKVKVEGQTCRLTLAASRGRYVSFRRPSNLTDESFVLSLLPDHRWVVVPRAALPAKQTTFAPEPKPNYGTRNTRHDWPDYINAWHLLTAEKAQAEAA